MLSCHQTVPRRTRQGRRERRGAAKLHAREDDGDVDADAVGYVPVKYHKTDGSGRAGVCLDTSQKERHEAGLNQGGADTNPSSWRPKGPISRKGAKRVTETDNQLRQSTPRSGVRHFKQAERGAGHRPIGARGFAQTARQTTAVMFFVRPPRWPTISS